jgi:hypothetical protein
MLAARRFLFIATVGGIPAATYDCDFTTLTTLADLTSKGWTYSRTGLGTYVDSTGTVVNNPHNLCFQSEAWNVTGGAGWGNQSMQLFGSGSVADAAVAPDGTTTADLITETTANTGHGFFSNGNSVSWRRGATYTLSVHAKKPTSNARDFISVGAEILGGTYVCVRFNMNTGAYDSTLSSTAGTIVAYGSTALPNNWYRFYVTFTISGTGTAGGGSLRIGPSTATATHFFGFSSYLGDGVSGLLVWGAQIEWANTLRTYVPTTTAAIYWPRLDSTKGLLLEAGTTNSLNWSEAFLTAGGSVMNWVYTSLSTSTGSVSPNGSTNALKFTHTGAGPQGIVAASGPVGTTNNRALSFWARRVTGTGTVWYSINNGIGQIPLTGLTTSWQRYEFVYSNANHQVALGLDTAGDEVEFWGIQLETSGWPTSYISTANATVARATDAIEMLAAQATFLNASAGSLVSEYAIPWAGSAGSAVSQFVRIGQGGASSWYALGAMTVGGTSAGARETEGWNPLWHFTTSNYTNLLISWNTSTYRKAGFKYTLGSAFKGFLAGTGSATLTPSASMTTLNKIDLACQRLGTSGTVPVTGTARVGGMWIKRLQYWNTSLSDSNMTTLTT